MSATATVLRKSAKVSSDALCVIRIPVLREGISKRGSFERLGSKVIQAGGTFDYRSADKGLLSRTYYNIEFTGSKRLLRWVAVEIDNGDFGY